MKRSRLDRLTRLGFADWTALLQMAVLLPIMRLALWLLPFKRIKAFVARASSTGVIPPQDRDYLDRTAWAATVLGRRLLGDKPCLTQSLLVQWLLRRRGYETEIRIGVAKDGTGDVRAHAWLEYEGKVILGGRRSPYRYRLLKKASSRALKSD